jgi:hypothetical protein
MPVCPVCHIKQERRVGGACPNCGAQVEVHKGLWYRAGLGSPSVAILKHFEKRVSQSLSYGCSNPVIFTIPRKGIRYKRELVTAERLLNDCDGDYDLAIASLDVLFDDNKFNWKTRDTLLYIEPEFLVALAIAKADQEIKREKERREAQALAQIMNREDIF